MDGLLERLGAAARALGLNPGSPSGASDAASDGSRDGSRRSASGAGADEAGDGAVGATAGAIEGARVCSASGGTRGGVASGAGGDCTVAASLSDDDLLSAMRWTESLARRVETIRAQLGAEVARRSDRSLGMTGLAVREGFADAAALLRGVTGAGRREAARSIRLGRILVGAEGAEGAEIAGVELERGVNAELGAAPPWGDRFEPVAAAVRDGRVSAEAADHIVRALEPIIDVADPEHLRGVLAALVIEAGRRDADEVGVMARQARAVLDRAGVKKREEGLRSQRSLRRTPVRDGLRRMTLVLDPESDAIVTGALDAALSPRLGGPRFVAEAGRKAAAKAIPDERSLEQAGLDALVDLVRIGVERDDGAVLGAAKPCVRVTIPYADLLASAGGSHSPTNGGSGDDVAKADQGRGGADIGVGWLDGHPEPLSASTVRRLLCEAGIIPVVFGGAGEILDLGRARRLFTSAQRTALAVRDGGCRWPGCDRPPSWCEAHHINPFHAARPGMRKGRTDLGEGVLLCRRHHLLLHNHGWWIERTGPSGDLALIPPTSIDPLQRPRPIPPRTPQRFSEHARRPGSRAPTTRAG